jgi:hypothetical protein
MENSLEEKNVPARHIKMVFIEPGYVMLVGMAAGFLYGALMVALDPWLRFPDVPLRLNWREMFLTSAMLGAYAALIGWIVTSFWRSWKLWGAALLFTPIVAAVVSFWNNLNSAFGLASDWLIFLPMTAFFNLVTVGLVYFLLNLSLYTPQRRQLVYAALPIALFLVVFMGLGRIRWSNPDAQDVMAAVQTYAGGLNEPEYSVEFLGMRYSGNTAPVGNAFIHTQGQTLLCRVRLFPQGADISCSVNE